jgi:hypothetical protein
MDAIIFEIKTGSKPINDDLDRVNCRHAGEIGHNNCGWCGQHDKPMFMCGCGLRHPELRIDPADAVLGLVAKLNKDNHGLTEALREAQQNEKDEHNNALGLMEKLIDSQGSAEQLLEALITTNTALMLSYHGRDIPDNIHGIVKENRTLIAKAKAEHVNA